MIQSLDGVKLKRGDICFCVGVTVGGIYMPCRCVAHSRNPSYSPPDDSKLYSTRAACQQECDRRNNEKVRQP